MGHVSGEGRRKCWWEDNMNANVTEIGCEDVDRFHLTEDRFFWRDVLNTVMAVALHKRREIY